MSRFRKKILGSATYPGDGAAAKIDFSELYFGLLPVGLETSSGYGLKGLSTAHPMEKKHGSIAAKLIELFKKNEKVRFPAAAATYRRFSPELTWPTGK